MTTLLSILLINAVVVVPLAAAVWFVSRLARRPALTHILWVLVLFKLITPPFFRLPFSVTIPAVGHSDQAETNVAMVQCSDTDRLPVESNAQAHVASTIVCEPPATKQSPVETESGNASTLDRNALGQDTGTSGSPLSTPVAIVVSWTRSVSDQIGRVVTWMQSQPMLKPICIFIWVFGSCFWFCHQAVRGVRFWRGIKRHATCDLRLQRHVRQLANRFGLKRCPQVVLIDAQLSPMLWGYGSHLRLLFPADLAKRLGHDARATLLAHELAHFSRGDHWIRVLELFVTGAFWWHPVVWLARNRIEESEEECCDAWVVSELPHAPRQYAEALLDTIDFLCDAPACPPPLASGLGTAAFLRRRLTRIMQGVSSKELSSRQRCGVLLIALLALPMQPFVLGSSVPARPLLQSTVPANVAAATPASANAAPANDSSTSVPAPRMPVPTSADSEPADPVTTSQSNSRVQLPSRNRSGKSAMPDIRSARGERVWGTAVSSDGRYAIHITTGRRAILTNLAQDQEAELTKKGLTCVAFFAEGDAFIAGSSDGQVTLWSAATAKPSQVLYAQDEPVRSVAVSPRGDMIAVGSPDGSVRLIDPANDHSMVEVSRNGSAVNCVRFAPDGRHLAAAVGDWSSGGPGQVMIWDVQSGQLSSLLHCAGVPGALSFASNEDLIVGQWNGQISLWNLKSKEMVGSAMADKNLVTASSFSPDNPSLHEVSFFPTRQHSEVADIQR